MYIVGRSRDKTSAAHHAFGVGGDSSWAWHSDWKPTLLCSRRRRVYWPSAHNRTTKRQCGPARQSVLGDGSASSYRNRRRVVGTYLGRLRTGAERICFLQLRFDRRAPDRRCRRKLCAQLVPLLFAVLTPMDFAGM